jgi:hypothetical protein
MHREETLVGHAEPVAKPVFARAEVDWPTLLRPGFVFLQGASVVITWPLWEVREAPPLLPVIDELPQLDLGYPLLASLLLILVRPVAGVLVHAAVLLVAFLLDQTRLQPEFVSLAIILFGTTSLAFARVVAKVHLIAVWFWAGVNKALSMGFMSESAQWLFDSSPVSPEFSRPYFGWIIIASEVSIALCLLVPRLRRAGVVLAVALHALTLLTLVGVGWNESVWPWNVALAMAATAFFWRPAGEPHEWRGVSLAILLIFGLLPIGFYGGYVDAYIAHNLYTSNTARAEVCRPDGVCSSGIFQQTWTELRVPLPPEPRLYVQYFDQLCAPSESLLVHPRRTRVVFGRDVERSEHECRSVED